MQGDPIKPKFKAPGSKRLKLKYGEQLSASAFKFNLRRYVEDNPGYNFIGLIIGRGLHSSTLQLNLGAFCVTGGAVQGLFGGFRGW